MWCQLKLLIIQIKGLSIENFKLTCWAAAWQKKNKPTTFYSLKIIWVVSINSCSQNVIYIWNVVICVKDHALYCFASAFNRSLRKILWCLKVYSFSMCFCLVLNCRECGQVFLNELRLKLLSVNFIE